MPLLKNIRTLAVCPAHGGQGETGEIDDAAIAWRDGRIAWAGPETAIPNEWRGEVPVDAGGRLVIPGLVDCHTHLAFGGWRADEFEMRCQGKGYLEIARAGGGIASTVRQTRGTSKEALLGRCRGFLDEMRALGVTTVECKSGYGLNEDDEIKTLEVYDALRRERRETIVSTFLGAHIVPPEYSKDREAYIRMLTRRLIPRIASAKLAEFCDIFVEDTAFTPSEARAILATGAAHGLRPKLHADQLSDTGGAALAAETGAASADHLEFASEYGIRAMAEAGVVAVNLPIATLYLDQQPMDASRFIEAGVPVAVATDFNPGSAPSFHLPLALLLACTRSRMTPREALKGATIFAAHAIGREAVLGSLEPGKQADFVLIDAPSVNHWLYHFRAIAAAAVYIRGECVAANADFHG